MGEACRGNLHDGSPCLRGVVQGSGYCIFHLPDKEGELTERFEEAFLCEVERQREAHPDYLDFTGFQFPTIVIFSINLPNIFFDNATFNMPCYFCVFSGHPENIYFTHIIEEQLFLKPITFEGTAGFLGATFEGDAGFYGATFEGDAGFDGAKFKEAWFDEAKFEGSARFHGAKFEGDAGFDGAKFKEAWFDGTTFKGSARFLGATFEEAWFNEAKFEGDAWFLGATFEGDAWFNEATFKGSAIFDGATFNSYAGFDGAKFEGSAWFLGAAFEGDASFNTTNFNGLTTYKQICVHKVIGFAYTKISSLFNLEVNQWIKDNTDESIHLSLIKIRRPSFSKGGKIIITGNTGKYEENHISGISLIDSELKNVEFLDDQWIRLNPSERKMSVDEILLDLKTKRKIEADDVSAANTAQLYRRLRDNYEEAKRYEEAGDWFLGEMEIRRKHDPSPATRVLHTIYYILAKYGESVLLPFTWSILTISMTTIYLASSRGITSINKMFSEALLDALLMFLPFKTPDSYLSLFLHMVGALILSLHYIALRRKLERR